MSNARTHTTTTTTTTTAGTTGGTAAEHTAGRTRSVRGLWTVICAVVTVVLGPAAVTASALDQANAAPPLHAVRADRTQAYIPADTGRRRTV